MICFWIWGWIIGFMNLLGGPKVRWRILMMFLCFMPNFVFISIFTQNSFELIFLELLYYLCWSLYIPQCWNNLYVRSDFKLSYGINCVFYPCNSIGCKWDNMSHTHMFFLLLLWLFLGKYSLNILGIFFKSFRKNL